MLITRNTKVNLVGYLISVALFILPSPLVECAETKPSMRTVPIYDMQKNGKLIGYRLDHYLGTQLINSYKCNTKEDLGHGVCLLESERDGGDGSQINIREPDKKIATYPSIAIPLREDSELNQNAKFLDALKRKIAIARPSGQFGLDSSLEHMLVIRNTHNIELVFFGLPLDISGLTGGVLFPAISFTKQELPKALVMQDKMCINGTHHYVWTYPFSCVTLPWEPSNEGDACPLDEAKTIEQVVKMLGKVHKASGKVYVYLLGFADKDDGGKNPDVNMIISGARVLAWNIMLRKIFPDKTKVEMTNYCFGYEYHHDMVRPNSTDEDADNPYSLHNEIKINSPTRSYNRRVEIIISLEEHPPYVASLLKAWPSARTKKNVDVNTDLWKDYQDERRRIDPAQNIPSRLKVIQDKIRKSPNYLQWLSG